jgi:hypothetical protein
VCSEEHEPLFAVDSHALHVPPPPSVVLHDPATHAFPLHEFPQEPQLFGSVSVLTHFVPHEVSFVVHAWSVIDSVDVVMKSSHAFGWIVCASSEPVVFAP